MQPALDRGPKKKRLGKKKISPPPVIFFAPLPPLLLAGSPKTRHPKINHVNGRKIGEASELTKKKQLSSAAPAH